MSLVSIASASAASNASESAVSVASAAYAAYALLQARYGRRWTTVLRLLISSLSLHNHKEEATQVRPHEDLTALIARKRADLTIAVANTAVATNT